MHVQCLLCVLSTWCVGLAQLVSALTTLPLCNPLTPCVCTGLTLQSGLIVTRAQLQESYPDVCCLPRAALRDLTPVVRVDGSDGTFYVSNDAQCAAPITAAVYPATFEYISVCGGCPPGGCTSTQAAAVADASLVNGGAAAHSITQPAHCFNLECCTHL